MDIDVMDLNASEIIEILENYPRGILDIKNDRVFWCSETITPRRRESERENKQPTPKNQMAQASRAFQTMGDRLGSMLGGPASREPERRRDDRRN